MYDPTSNRPVSPFTASVVVRDTVDSRPQPAVTPPPSHHCCRLYDARAESSAIHMEDPDSITNAVGAQPGEPLVAALNPGNDVALSAPVGRVAPSCTTADTTGEVESASPAFNNPYRRGVPGDSVSLICIPRMSAAPGAPAAPAMAIVTLAPDLIYRTLLGLPDAPAT